MSRQRLSSRGVDQVAPSWNGGGRANCRRRACGVVGDQGPSCGPLAILQDFAGARAEVEHSAHARAAEVGDRRLHQHPNVLLPDRAVAGEREALEAVDRALLAARARGGPAVRALVVRVRRIARPVDRRRVRVEEAQLGALVGRRRLDVVRRDGDRAPARRQRCAAALVRDEVRRVVASAEVARLGAVAEPLVFVVPLGVLLARGLEGARRRRRRRRRRGLGRRRERPGGRRAEVERKHLRQQMYKKNLARESLTQPPREVRRVPWSAR